MPTISMFYGIIIAMFFEIKEKHHLPHIHIRYQGFHASFRLKTAQCWQVICLFDSCVWFRSGLICIEKSCWQIGSLRKKVLSLFELIRLSEGNQYVA